MKKIFIILAVSLLLLVSCEQEATIPSIDHESVETTASTTTQKAERSAETETSAAVDYAAEVKKHELKQKIYECEKKLAKLEEEKAEVLAEFDKECDRIIKVRDDKISSAAHYSSGEYARGVIEQAKRTCEQELTKVKALRNEQKEYYNTLIENVQDEIFGYKTQLERLG